VETGTTGLGERAIPPLDEINRLPEFDAREIARDEFEALWARALKDHAGPLRLTSYDLQPGDASIPPRQAADLLDEPALR
jgi:hypothetical protein